MNIATRQHLPSGLNYQLSIEQLEAFVVTVETGSFSAAARKLNKAQSSVSGLISNLEIETGFSLFDRSKNRPTLTRHGGTLLQHAEAVVASHRDLLARVVRLNINTEQVVRLTLDESVFRKVALSQLLREFQSKFTDTTLTITSALPSQALDWVRQCKTDIAVLTSREENNREFHFRPIGQLQYGIVVSPTHPLANATRQSHDALRQHRQIALLDPREQRQIGDEFQTQNSNTIFTNQYDLLIDWLMQGLGWAELPLCAVQTELNQKKLIQLNIELEHIPRLRDVDILWSHDAETGAAMKWLISTFPKIGGDFLQLR